MTREPADPIPSEAKDACAEADDDRSADARPHEQPDVVARPARYLWPALASLWQGGAQ
jgi:hypothetical protein